LPIALMADHQTTGGYPKIAEIAAAEVARLAQLKPGGSVRFARCTLGEAVAPGETLFPDPPPLGSPDWALGLWK
jgi:allophanate hydrolase subunit 2